MKLICNFLLLILLVIPASLLVASDTARVIILSPRVGDTIDVQEREYYHLFTTQKNFFSAVFYKVSPRVFFVRIESIEKSGQHSFNDILCSEGLILNLAEKVNHYEEIASGTYRIGDDPASIQFANSPPMLWDPPLGAPEAADSTQELSQAEYDSLLLYPKRNIEFRLLSGYGISKGGMAFRSYDYDEEAVTYDRWYTNVSDNYSTVGQGLKIEMRGIKYLSEQIGIFAQFEYSSGSVNFKRNYRVPSNNITLRYTEDSKEEFGYTAIASGIHFSATNGFILPYCGAGAGIYFPSKVIETTNIVFSYPNGNSGEQQVEYSVNSSIGFVGYLGSQIFVTPTLSLFCEIKMNLVSFYITKAELTKYTFNGRDQLISMTTYDKVKEYKENTDMSVQSSIDYTKPEYVGPPYPFPANSISFNLGLSISL